MFAALTSSTQVLLGVRFANGLCWFGKCVLVLVLALDHFSAPFHNHVHDGFLFQPTMATIDHDAHDADVDHAGRADHHNADKQPVLSHATGALRHESLQLLEPTATSAFDAAASWALMAAVVLPARVDTASPTHWRPNRSLADIPFHHSLPPAGRAPPLHAA